LRVFGELSDSLQETKWKENSDRIRETATAGHQDIFKEIGTHISNIAVVHSPPGWQQHRIHRSSNRSGKATQQHAGWQQHSRQ
jgi:hypothetical protein